MIKIFLQYCFIIVVFSASINRTNAQNASDSVVLDYKVNLELNVQNQIKKTAFFISTQQNYIAIDSNFIREISGTNFKPFDFQLISDDSIFAFIDINGIKTVRKEANNQQYVVQFIDGKQFYNDLFFQKLATTKANIEDSLVYDILHQFENVMYRIRVRKINSMNQKLDTHFLGFWGLGFIQDGQQQQYKIISIEFAQGYLSGTKYENLQHVIQLSDYIPYSDSILKFQQINQDSLRAIYQDEIKNAERVTPENDYLIQKIKTERSTLAQKFSAEHKITLPDVLRIEDLKNYLFKNKADSNLLNIIHYDYLIQRRALEINIKNTPDTDSKKNKMYQNIICIENKRKVVAGFKEKWMEAIEMNKQKAKTKDLVLSEYLKALELELKQNFSDCPAN